MTGSAKQSIFAAEKKAGLLRRFAPLRKRIAFVAGNDDLSDHHGRPQSVIAMARSA
jgi:hypothetical protein